MQILINWIVSALIILALAFLLPGVFVGGFVAALVVALALGIINALIRPLALLLTLPLNLLTLGLFTLVVDTFMVLLAAWVVPTFEVSSFWWAFAFSISLGIVNFILESD